MVDMAAGASGIPQDKERVVITKRVNWPLRLAKWLLAGLLLLLVLAGIAVVSLNTDTGRRFVADRIERLEFASGMRIRVAAIEGSLYGAATLRGLTLSDPKGVFFSAPLVRLDWRPWDYLNNHLDVRSIQAPTATLRRMPEFRETPPSDAPLLPDLDITVGHLTIERLVLEAPVTGERRVGFIDGRARIADRRAQVALQAAVVGGEGRPGGDRLALRLDAVPEENRLGLDGFLSGPDNGLVAQLTGIAAPVKVRLSGRGDWRNWNGRLLADLRNRPFARLQLGARDGTFSVQGPTRVADLVEGPTAALLGPITTVALQSTWENRRADLRGRAASDAFTLQVDGTADLGRNRLDDLRLDFVLRQPGALAPNLTGQNLRAQAVLNGELCRPTIDYRLSAATLAFGDTGVLGLEARGTARFQRDFIAVPIAARARAITGLDTVAGGTITNVRLDGDLAVDWPRILSENLRIRSDRIDATALVLADVASGLYTGAIDGRVNNYRINSVGLFNIETNADLRREASGGISLVGSVRARSTRLFNDGVRDFLGGNLVTSADVRYGSDGIIRFSRLRLAAPELRVTDGAGTYTPDGRIDLRARGVSRAYGPVGVQLAGTVASPRAIVTADRPGFGIGVSGLRADIRSTGNAYLVLARGRSDYGDFTADVAVQTAAGPLTIDIRRASIAGIDVRGRVRQAAAGPFIGQLQASGNGLSGALQLAAAGRFQQATVRLRASNTVLPEPAGIAVGTAIVDARVILYDRPEIVADVQLADALIGTTDIRALRAQVNYQGGQGFARGIVEGTSGVPFRLAVNTELQPRLWRAALRGRVSGIDVRTDSPARILPRNGSYELLPTRLVFDRGSARLSGTFGDRVQLQSRIDNLDLEVVNAFVPNLGVDGTVTGSIDFVQAGGLPRLNASLAVRNFTRTTAATVSRPLNINLVTRLDPDAAELRAVMRTRGTVIGRVQAFADPLGPGAGPWTERIADAPLRGGIRYVGPADSLFSLAGLADQRLTGTLGVAADFAGRVSRPNLAGIVRGRGLTYDNATYGTRLSNMVLAGRFTGDRIQIDQLSANAGSGTVTGQGFISLAASRGYPAEIALTLDNARLANSDDLRVAASGNVRLIKAAGQNPVLTGTVRLPETRYRIVRQGAADVPVLTGVRFKPPRGRPRVTGDAPAPTGAGFGDVALDLNIVAPNELFVSGMGLESEWRANLRVTGTSSAPRIAGDISLVRGTLGFAGRSFNLEEGRIRFPGGGTDDARITLVAQEEIEEVTVTVNVTGSASDPRITFSSSPGLPQDEIVSRILFGNSVGQLSAIQAVQLAASLNALRGSGGGLNPLGQLRQAAGFDRLRILGPDEASGRGTALAAGRYLGDDIYLEVVTDARGFTATQLEVTLSRSLSILSEVGGAGKTNINVRYRKTY